MRKPASVATLTKLGREQLSPHFFMREMLYSEVASIHGMQNIPSSPDRTIAAGRKLCVELLEPLRATFGHVSIRSAYRSYEVNKFCCEQQRKGKAGYTCACDNDARHVWDRTDMDGLIGATASISIPWFVNYLREHKEESWTAMAWWIHDNLPYSELCFFRANGPFNIRWHEGPEPKGRIRSYTAPRGLLTEPGRENHSGDHSSEYPDFPELILPLTNRASNPATVAGLYGSDLVKPARNSNIATEIRLLVEDFCVVAERAGFRLFADDLKVESLPAPHIPPTRLPDGKIAVYIFSYQGRALKIGQAGPKSGPRYASQHYNPKGAKSTLAKSIFARGSEIGVTGLSESMVGAWIKSNTGRFNILLDSNQPKRLLTLLEAFAQCRLNPIFEGFTSQR